MPAALRVHPTRAHPLRTGSADDVRGEDWPGSARAPFETPLCFAALLLRVSGAGGELDGGAEEVAVFGDGFAGVEADADADGVCVFGA